MDKIESAILRWLAILLIPAVAGLSVHVSVLLDEYENTRNISNGYIPPNDLYSVVTRSNEATVSIECENKSANKVDCQWSKPNGKLLMLEENLPSNVSK